MHTAANRFCDDPTCACHEETDLINRVNQEYEAGLLTSEEATRIIEGKQL